MSKIESDAKGNVSSWEYYFARINKFDDLFSFIYLLDNWPQYLVRKFIFKKGVELKVKKIVNITYNKEGIWFRWHNRNINFCLPRQDKKFDIIWLINENFIKEQYKWLDVEGKNVVDVGANIGDSAIYFALEGAKHVYAFEPYPYSYNIAKKNIKLNHLEDKITLLNEGCGKSGFVTIKEDYENTGGTDLKKFKKGKKIRIESLDEIVKRFDLKHAALKVDCEGCEYDLILNASDEALHAFDQIIIEYHYGYKNLQKQLEICGFTAKNTHPKTTLYNKKILEGKIFARVL